MEEGSEEEKGGMKGREGGRENCKEWEGMRKLGREGGVREREREGGREEGRKVGREGGREVGRREALYV